MTSTKIPGFVYLIVGAAVSGFSKFVESKNQKTNLTLFFYIGLLFIAIGIFKIAYKYIVHSKQPNYVKNKTPNQMPNANNRNMQNRHLWQQNYNQNNYNRNQAMQNQRNQSHQGGFSHTNSKTNQIKQSQSFENNQNHVIKIEHPTQPEHPSIITCPGCGVKHYSYANFCMMCGLMIKKK